MRNLSHKGIRNMIVILMLTVLLVTLSQVNTFATVEQGEINVAASQSIALITEASESTVVMANMSDEIKSNSSTVMVMQRAVAIFGIIAFGVILRKKTA